MAERTAANPGMDLPAFRDMMEELHTMASEPEGVRYAELSAGGVPALACIPDQAVSDRVLLFTHGGGFVTNSAHSHRKLVGHLAKALGVRGLSLDYRLAPENIFPAALEDAKAAYRWLLSEGIQPGHIVTAGDSAGANLATGVVLALIAEGVAPPAGIIGFSPFYDLALTGPTMDSNATRDAFVQRAILDNVATWFLGPGVARTNPLANPLHADLSGLPPVFLTVGEDETLLSDSQRFVERAERAGVDTQLRVVPGMQHIFVMMAGRADEADDVIAEVATWARPKLGLT
jgi:acetyl esterase/lipase